MQGVKYLDVCSEASIPFDTGLPEKRSKNIESVTIKSTRRKRNFVSKKVDIYRSARGSKEAQYNDFNINQNVDITSKSEYFNSDANLLVHSNSDPQILKYDSLKEEGNMLLNNLRLASSYYTKPCIDLAKNLLGKVLTRKLPNGTILRGRIVETESYLGVDDKACHSYKGKKTDRNKAMFMKPGTAYVYTIYGMYHCFNISSEEEGSAVLIRALEPLEGLDAMRKMRSVRKISGELKDRDLCNGPSKLCQALKIEKLELNKEDLSVSDILWLENHHIVEQSDIVSCKRIGIESAGEEWANKPLRFYVRNSKFVSVRNKLAENILSEGL